jgi:hypothetical protein
MARRTGSGATPTPPIVDVPDYQFRTAAPRSACGTGSSCRRRAGVRHRRHRRPAGLGQGFTFTQDVIGVKVKADWATPSTIRQPGCPRSRSACSTSPTTRARSSRRSAGRTIRARNSMSPRRSCSSARACWCPAQVRYTNANQTGLLGFGGDANDDREAQFEGSVGWLLSRNLVVGAEYRTKPDNLSSRRKTTGSTSMRPMRSTNISRSLPPGRIWAPSPPSTISAASISPGLQAGF